MASKHTPAPWSLSPTDDTIVIDAAGREVAAIDGDYNDPDTWPLMEANARLIASAPELYESLCDLIASIENCTITGETMAAAKAAKSKAEGE